MSAPPISTFSIRRSRVECLDTAQSDGAVVFAVPGHPRFGERSVPLIEAGARELGIPIEVQDAVSFLDVVAATLRIDPVARGLQIADAEELAEIIDRRSVCRGQTRRRSDPAAAGRAGL